MSPKDKVHALVCDLIALAADLPTTIELGTPSDKLYITFTTDCRDEAGRLPHLRRGPFGLDLVCTYLKGLLASPAAEELPYELVKIKLERLTNEVKALVSSQSPLGIVPAQSSSGLKLKIPARQIAQSSPTRTGSLTVSEDAVTTSTGSVTAAPSVVPAVAIKSAAPLAVTTSSNGSAAGKRQGRTVKNVKQLPLNAVLRGPTVPVLPDDDPKDATYKPPRREEDQQEDEDACQMHVYRSDGEEILEDVPHRPSRKRTASSIVISSDSESSDQGTIWQKLDKMPLVRPGTSQKAARTVTGKYKRPPRPKKKARRAMPSSDNEAGLAVSSGSESDGQGALREVEAQDSAAKSKKRGPENTSLKHWHSPVPIRERKKGDRWQFKCRYCSAVRTFKRTVGGEQPSFEDEPRKPSLANLASHLKDDHPKVLSGSPPPEDGKATVDHGYTLHSAKLMEDFLKEGALNPALVPTQKGFYRVFAAWILDDNLPFTMGESPSLARLFQYLKVKFVLPSDTTVRNILAQIFAELHSKVVRELANVKSKIAYSTDTWSTRQMVFTFAGTLAHFIDDDWKLVERLVDFYHVQDDEHKGQEGAKAFVASASKRGGLDKMSPAPERPSLWHHWLTCVPYFVSLTMDNASANDVLARTVGLLLLKRYGIHFTPENGRIRCIAHVVNLVVQKILSKLFEADDPVLADYYELWNKHLPFHYDLEADDENHQFQNENKPGDPNTENKKTNYADDPASPGESDEDDDDEDDDDGMDDVEDEYAGKSALKKLRLICNKIVSSPQRRSQFRKVTQRTYTSSSAEDIRRQSLMVIRDVATRWNYTHAMIERGLLLQDVGLTDMSMLSIFAQLIDLGIFQAIDTWVFHSKKLRGLLLSPSEWQTLRQIGEILSVSDLFSHSVAEFGMVTSPRQVFTKVTHEMSYAGRPTLPFVLPVYEQMRKSLQAHVEDATLPPPLRNAVAAGLLKLQEYYQYAKESQYTVVATVVHPSLRLNWFRALGDAHRLRAEVIFQHVYEEYATLAEPQSDQPDPPVPTLDDNSRHNDSFLEAAVNIDGNDPCPASTASSNQPERSELDRYLAGDGGAGSLRDPLAWWK
ncbi:hypothetical protein BN946_scf184727.g1, partial [Trametes cinnabarina]